MKTKKMMYGALSALLLSPMVALGQWDVASNPSAGAGLPEGTISGIILQIMNWILILIGIVGVIGFVIAGILYLTAAGDDSKAGTAKQAMTYSIIGVIVGLMGYVIIQAVNTMLGGTANNF